MKAVRIESNELHWSEVPDPTVAAGEILVSVAAAGLNGADRLQLAGLYPAPPGSPADIPGLEFAGTVVEVGDGATRFSVGDRVMGVVGGGAQAELIAVHERLALAIPDRLDFTEAGGFPEAFTTAHDALFTQANLGMGERLCVNGAAGGVGVAAIQLASAAGAHVTATCRHPSLLDALIKLGANEAIDATASAAGPFDVVLELVGAPNLSNDLRSLATLGRLVVIGVGAGARAEVSLLDLMNRRASIMGSTLRARSLEDKAAAARLVERHVLPLVESGRLKVPVHERFSMSDAAAAYEAFSRGRKLGKIVLVNPSKS
jgi:putative PIG3 family NAD(P)H quinone oxidoreductase